MGFDVSEALCQLVGIVTGGRRRQSEFPRRLRREIHAHMRTCGPFLFQEGLRQKEALYGAVFSVLRQMQELGARGRILLFW